ncbi:pYEATS domain-containing protein [Phyllobacterium chamaecytisi]|uniref:pYEATS domain-containing protein n=1 Tax=Phyllobacterium chamaecytisi TaxID=2876082 RepID=UPI001CCCA278|nr:pYEATS domain-containing protein [Phyllobacterium sp. KW56]MBZ9603105.1 hypothetical protein [Phyllobacterium sp. KW56]
MSEQKKFKDNDWTTLRAAFVREELRRYRIASYALLSIATLTFSFLVLLVTRDFREPTWQFIALLGFASVCVALPLLSKVNFSKDGGSVEVSNPIELIDQMETRAQAARSESFEQTRKQIGALSVQISELLAKLENGPVSPGAPSEPGSKDALEKIEPSMHEIRALLPAPTIVDDPQKGRFGGQESNPSRALSAKVSPSDLNPRWQKVIFTLKATDRRPLKGAYAYFFLHDTFEPNAYRVKIRPGSFSVSFEATAVGAFTVGVIADDGDTKLELDLASANIDAPKDWKER